ncbi:MAG: endolytic transglycosylase MltG, partial [Gemmatimonadales bacterium]
IIAGVYRNRLRLGMALQADPTVQYAIQLKTGERKPRLFFKDYEIRSPYNTYLHPGLPPGPVNSPGIRSILAALYPAPVPYLYFVAQPDGHHLFTRTIAEHQAAIGRVRRMARNGGKP